MPMVEYTKFISEKRRSVPTPDDIQHEGQAVFGTFDKEFANLNMLKIHHPTAFPSFLNEKKLTRWEALEVEMKEGSLVVGLANMGISANMVTTFFDRRSNILYSWTATPSPKKANIASNLLNGSVTEIETKNFGIRFTNNFQDGKARIVGHHSDKNGQSISFEFEVTRVSKPSIVSIPFGSNRPLYTQKDLFHAEGSLSLNGETFVSDDHTMAVIDDHKGYYPRRMHYDWLTFMGNSKQGQPLGFNLTKNQSIDPQNYNENLIWLSGSSSLLPPVHFAYSAPTKKFISAAKTPTVWTVMDEHDMVCLKFTVKGVYKMIVHALVIDIQYFVVYGSIDGYLRKENGEKIEFKDAPGIGEDKTMLV